MPFIGLIPGILKSDFRCPTRLTIIVLFLFSTCFSMFFFCRSGPSEILEFESESVDLVTTCQAIHWFDIPRFYKEVDRILRPQGVLAIYGYHLTGPAPETASNLTQEQVRGLEVLRDKVLSFYYCNILPLVGWEFFPKFVHRQKNEMIIDFTEFFYKEWKYCTAISITVFWTKISSNLSYFWGQKLWVKFQSSYLLVILFARIRCSNSKYIFWNNSCGYFNKFCSFL